MKLAVAWDPLSFTDGDGGSLEKSRAALRSKPLRPVARQEGAIASARRAECLKLYAEMKGFVVEHLRLLGRNWLQIDVYGAQHGGPASHPPGSRTRWSDSSSRLKRVGGRSGSCGHQLMGKPDGPGRRSTP